MDVKPYRPSRNTYLAFLHAWDQYQACADPLHDFKGVDIEKIREDTHRFVTSDRRMHATEVTKALKGLSGINLIVYRDNVGYTFAGPKDGERFGATLADLRKFYENPDNRRWWIALVIIASMRNGERSRTTQAWAEFCGLQPRQVEVAWRQLARGFKVKTEEGDEETFKGKVVEIKPGVFRLPDHLLFDSTGSTDNLDDIIPDDEPAAPKPVTDPNKMHGAGDGFGGQDGMASPSAAAIRQELAKIGGPPATKPPVVVPLDSKGNGGGSSLLGQIIVPISKDDYHLISAHLTATKGIGIAEQLEAHVGWLRVKAEKWKKDGDVQKKLADLKAKRNQTLSEFDAEISKLEAQLSP